jgi:hypothetical protein
MTTLPSETVQSLPRQPGLLSDVLHFRDTVVLAMASTGPTVYVGHYESIIVNQGDTVGAETR